MNNTPTPRTDEATLLATDIEQGGNFNAVHVQVAQRLERELTAVTEQRDRLVEAFQDMLNDTLTPTNDEWIVTDNENYIEIASIKTCDSIASVHGGKTIGDQYDLAGRIARVPQLERELIAAREEIEMMGIRYAAAEMHHANNMHEVTEQRDRLETILKECLYEMPCGYVPNHTIEKLPHMIANQTSMFAEEITHSEKLVKQRDLLIEVLEVTLNATVLNHRNDRWHSDAEYALHKIKLNLK